MSAHPYDNDPGLAVVSKRNSTRLPVELTYPVWTHPQVVENAYDWQLIRDCARGARAVKDRGTDYLPPLDEMTQKEYAAYLDRAVFFNMTGRTVSALTGIVFQRSPQVSNLPKKLEKKFRLPTRNGITFDAFLKKICRELVTLGRFGVLVDMDTDTGNDPNAAPYFTGYSAEHILDWQETVIDGRLVPTEIVLREFREVRGPFGVGKTQKTTYRRLVLEWSEQKSDFIYAQYVYEGDQIYDDMSKVVPVRIVPNRNGVPFNRIPFAFLGAIDNTPEIDRSPIADIADLNIAHYRSYAQLEHSRYYTAMPVWYAQVPLGNQKRTYKVGSAVVWECAPGEKPGILEMNGHGLTGLVAACEQKEDQISALGGRLMSGQTRSVAESDNSLRLKEGNERSILLNIVFSVSEGMTEMLRTWCFWAGQDNVDNIEVELNKEFLTDTLGARELRAVYAMYIDGVIPVTVLHHYLQKAEVIPDWMDVDQFKALLDDESEFKNNPDAIAKMKGYNTAKDRQDVRLARRELRNEEELTEQNRIKVEADAKAKLAALEAPEETVVAAPEAIVDPDNERQREVDSEEYQKDRDFEAEEAEKERQFKAAEAEKERKAKAAQAAEQRKTAEKTAAAQAKVAMQAAKAKPAPGAPGARPAQPVRKPGGGGAR